MLVKVKMGAKDIDNKRLPHFLYKEFLEVVIKIENHVVRVV